MSRDGTDPLAIDAAAAALEDGDGSELLGQLIDGRYRLEATLGRGGMGLVYRAAHVGLRRQVAVKILHPSLATSSDVRNRFEREALAVGKIDHPNCVSVYDVGRLTDGSLYLAMELLEGRALADVLEHEGQLAPGRALHILAGILRGLSHIHAAGLIHRDIKPENIFLIRHGSDEDFAKILDFGIAKPMSGKTDLDDGVKLTQAGMAFGTPIYMAPEQALGNPMDGRADLYAAAVLGYEMLCGQPPFYSEDKLEVMSMHTAKPVPPMRARLIKGGKPVPSSIERLIVRGLTKKPGERYATADIFLAAVEGALKTSDGGVTDVSFERPEADDEKTGALSLMDFEGRVKLATDAEFANEEASTQIANAIDDVLSTQPKRPRLPGVATPSRGQAPPPAVRSKPPTPAPPTRPTPAPGGVGLGLPYTGPSGEPIFGLTPEQRLAHAQGFSTDSTISLAKSLEPERSATGVVARPRRRLALYASIGGAAILAGVAIAVLTIPGDDTRPDADSPEGKALAAYDKKDFKAARSILLDHQATLADSATAQLLLGHVQFLLAAKQEALVAYNRAIQLDSKLESDKVMRSSLKAMSLNEKEPVYAAAAFDIWIRTHDTDARENFKAAAASEDLPYRHTVRAYADKFGVRAEVDWLKSYSFDLQQEPDCEKRRQAVIDLRGLGDPRAISALKSALVVNRQHSKAYVACIEDIAQETLDYLNSLLRPTKKPPPKAAPKPPAKGSPKKR